MVKEILFVGAGGALGSVLRYGTGQLIDTYFPGRFPLATLGINILGCFIIGVLMAYFLEQQQAHHARLFLITGFCGGYTTFSAFAAENLDLIQQGQLISAMFYIFLSVIVGIAAVWAGLFAFRLMG